MVQCGSRVRVPVTWHPIVLGLAEAYRMKMMAFPQFLIYLAVDVFLALLLSGKHCIMYYGNTKVTFLPVLFST